MRENKTSEAQIKAVKKWREKNRKKDKIDTYRRMARLYIRNHAEEENLQEVEEWVDERRKNLKENKKYF